MTNAQSLWAGILGDLPVQRRPAGGAWGLSTAALAAPASAHPCVVIRASLIVFLPTSTARSHPRDVNQDMCARSHSGGCACSLALVPLCPCALCARRAVLPVHGTNDLDPSRSSPSVRGGGVLSIMPWGMLGSARVPLPAVPRLSAVVGKGQPASCRLFLLCIAGITGSLLKSSPCI